MRTFLAGIARMARWLARDARDPEDAVACPVCGRTVRVAWNDMPGTAGYGLRIPRPVEETVGACNVQHGSAHTAAEIAAAKVEKPWR